MRQIRRILRTLWELASEACGENDYARYCARELADGHQPMTPQAFYLWKINRYYSRLNRCC